MFINNDFITSTYAELHYQIVGQGKHIWVSFHGFGQNHEVFLSLAKSLQEECTFYNFDLFYHGKSQWTDTQKTLTAERWQEVFRVFLQKHQITTFSLLAFSIGGRMASLTLVSFAENISKILLIAPDGVINHKIYQIATQNMIGRASFKAFLKVFPYLSPLIRFRKTALLRKSLATSNRRKRLYHTWLLLRKSPSLISKEISPFYDKKMCVYWIFGQYDKLISAEISQKIPQKNRHKIVILPQNHRNLLPEALRWAGQQGIFTQPIEQLFSNETVKSSTSHK